MQICRTIAETRTMLAAWRRAGDSVGLVPTMGALHDGHAALVTAARAERDRVVATIFVNPTQFGDPRDLETYPRSEAADLELLRALGADAVLIPDAAEIYPRDDETIVETTRLAAQFHGAVRPGHFRGVATVVTKLFNIIRPDAAYFGEKDYQQLAVIRRMVRDLHMGLDIVGVATFRDADGLALSSRNVRLTPADRAAAPVLHRALQAGAAVYESGATVEAAAQAIRDVVATEPRAELTGLDIVEAGRFVPATGRPEGLIGIMISARFGEVLLIDQKEVSA
ncbi:pantoate--beta-alanine ligase [Mesobaculum littorinae]|uniref:Pantothenate synthetase n=1 Tax=Mesobaculum littorinae TaxID=2486419 RepID=A0A438AFC2_9RHOB|nr:pantoate--beta-alanine ligase [Mesobaculum littorinae]RVV97404.1 pantoate--beta-alanine ligase [Mesobaculum littorinae]